MTFAAVVVSYNRMDLLKKCLYALEHQTVALDEIIVIDNGSTDGSADYVAKEHSGVTLFRVGKNVGGAGGFAWGVEIAMAHGHDATWLMDDDACPELDAVAPLISVFESTEPRSAFLASVVTAGRGNVNANNLPAISRDAKKQIDANRFGGIAIDKATFVGVFVNLHTAARTHLPLADFFIWVDDAEYTSRLSHLGPALMVPQSQVNHPADRPASNDMGVRLFYWVRNYLWFYRERTEKPIEDLLDTARLFKTCLKQFLVANDKKLWLRSVSKGLWQGMSVRPRHQPPGSLLGTLSAEQRAAIRC